MEKKPFEYKIVKPIAVLSESANGGTKEINLISYNGAEPKYDIRSWTKDEEGKERMGKGITLTKNELVELFSAIEKEL